MTGASRVPSGHFRAGTTCPVCPSALPTDSPVTWASSGRKCPRTPASGKRKCWLAPQVALPHHPSEPPWWLRSAHVLLRQCSGHRNRSRLPLGVFKELPKALFERKKAKVLHSWSRGSPSWQATAACLGRAALALTQLCGVRNAFTASWGNCGNRGRACHASPSPLPTHYRLPNLKLAESRKGKSFLPDESWTRLSDWTTARLKY